MGIRNCLLFITLIFLQSKLVGQGYFQKTYSNSAYSAGRSGIKTIDGGYIIAGVSQDTTTSNYNQFLVKTNALGDLEWIHSFGGSAINQSSNCVKQTNDNGFIVAGSKKHWPGGDFHFHLLKVDSQGNFQWSKSYDTLFAGFNKDVIQTQDSGYLLLGYTFNVPYLPDIMLIKTNSNGDQIWNKVIGTQPGTSAEYGFSMQQTSDNGLIIAGYIQDPNGSQKIWVLKLDSIWNISWRYTYGGGRAFSICQTNDEGYIITGYKSDTADVAFLLKIDSIGTFEWKKIFNRPSFINIGNAVLQVPDGGYLLTGQTGNLGTYDVFLFRTNAYGDTLWTKYIGDSGEDVGYSVQLTPDGGYSIQGYSDDLNTGYRSCYLLKTDSMGNAGCNEKVLNFILTNDSVTTQWHTISNTTLSINETSENNIIDTLGYINTLCTSVGQEPVLGNDGQITIYPNPVDDELIIEILNKAELEELKIIDLFGRIIFSQEHLPAHYLIKSDNWSSGLYFIYIKSNGNGRIRKIVKV